MKQYGETFQITESWIRSVFEHTLNLVPMPSATKMDKPDLVIFQPTGISINDPNLKYKGVDMPSIAPVSTDPVSITTFKCNREKLLRQKLQELVRKLGNVYFYCGLLSRNNTLFLF